MKLTVLAVGKLKDPPYRALEEHYLKLTGRYMPLELIEIRDEKLGAGRLSGAGAERAIRAEGERLIAKAPPRGRLVALDKEGKAHSSEELARWLEARTHEGRDVAFALGGPLGLGANVLEAAEEKLSLGPLTLPHQLARVVLLEQLYRAWTIIRGETYHY